MEIFSSKYNLIMFDGVMTKKFLLMFVLTQMARYYKKQLDT